VRLNSGDIGKRLIELVDPFQMFTCVRTEVVLVSVVSRARIETERGGRSAAGAEGEEKPNETALVSCVLFVMLWPLAIVERGTDGLGRTEKRNVRYTRRNASNAVARLGLGQRRGEHVARRPRTIVRRRERQVKTKRVWGRFLLFCTSPSPTTDSVQIREPRGKEKNEIKIDAHREIGYCFYRNPNANAHTCRGRPVFCNWNTGLNGQRKQIGLSIERETTCDRNKC